MSPYEGYVTLLNIQDAAQEETSQRYWIETNQEELVKFFVEERTWMFSPDNLIISVYESTSSEEGKKKIDITSLKDLTLSIFSYLNSETLDLDFSKETSGIKFYEIVDGNFIIFLQQIAEYFEGNSNAYKESPLFYVFDSIIRKEVTLKIIYSSSEDIPPIEKSINIRGAVTEDIAKLSVQANGIYASVASTALQFDAGGLTVRNGGFSILKDDYELTLVSAEDFNLRQYYIWDGKNYAPAEEYNSNETYYIKNYSPVLYADKNGDLNVKGIIEATSGKFTGEIYASKGIFNGEINANSGSIGGFTINADSIIGKNFELYSNYNNSGSMLKITNAELGAGAKITEYINLGNNVKILNPDINGNDGSFIQVFREDGENKTRIVDFNSNGTIILGNSKGNTASYIKLDGTTQQMSGWNLKNSNDPTWWIGPDEAIFNNATIRGSIKSAVFEYGTIQAIGGALLMRPSSRIISVLDSNTIELESDISEYINLEDVCLIDDGQTVKNYYKISQINGNKIRLDKNTANNSMVGKPLIILGKESSVAIGFNGSNNNLYGMNPNSISVMEFDGKDKLNSKIILGKLSKFSEAYGEVSNTYGLYAENVVLRGSLTTQNDTKFIEAGRRYSGIGTILDLQNAPNVSNIIEAASYFPNKKVGQILLWAGAKGTSAEDIEKSAFFVDEYGNMFAGSGYFDGTIITNSTIQAAEIKTAILTGTGTDANQPALKIQDVSKGIHFYNGDKAIFKLDNNEFSVNDIKISLNKKIVVDTEGNLKLSSLVLNDGTTIKESGIYNNKSYIRLSGDSSIQMCPGNNDIYTVNQSGLTINGSLYYAYRNTPMAEFKQAFEGDQVIGYDLFIY